MNRYKNALRKSYQQLRMNLPITYQKTASTQVCSRIKSMDQYRYAKSIALYHAVNGEIDLNEIWTSAPYQGKYCYFPILNEDLSLSFLPATPATPFKPNRFNIPEPDISRDKAIAVSELDLIFMPLVGFDRMGTRLGMGGGYYDRTLANENHPLLVGVAYDFQREDYIQPQPWDVPLTAIVTPQTIYWRET